jgi:hypothetical protein
MTLDIMPQFCKPNFIVKVYLYNVIDIVRITLLDPSKCHILEVINAYIGVPPHMYKYIVNIRYM